MTARMDERRAEHDHTAPLAERLREWIGREGALSFRDWMAAALYDEHQGYYLRRDVTRWGRAGDYRTSPERSPLFAATFAKYFATLYEELNAPPTWTIFEAGAGAGHFAHDVLASLRRDSPPVFAATRYIIDEISADSRAHAQERLAEFADRIEFARLADIHTPFEGIIFANELLDALPIHRAVRRGDEFLELCVDVDAAGKFVWVERESTTPRLFAHLQNTSLTIGDAQIAEVSFDALDWVARAASIIRRGYLVTVDYGFSTIGRHAAANRSGGTLRAFHQHRLVDDPLARPGEQDLTYTINWAEVKSAGERAGLQSVLFARQDEFLLQAGALNCLERMTSVAHTEAEVVALRLGAREMLLPGGMSESFQVLVQLKAADV